ncbi:MAG TPA: hypothetical protein VE033_14365 [Acetobacteraceae bacterium]|jgi:hypothetical protein|nr:hypothetical protein [Acetobacteraceae bacterium]
MAHVRPPPEAGSRVMRRIVWLFLGAAVLAAGGGVWASAGTGDWTWFSRSGAVLTGLGLLLASRKVLIARADLLALLQEMEAADGAERTARLASFKRLQRDIDRQLLERVGFGLLMLGTLVWGFGDLIGRL